MISLVGALQSQGRAADFNRFTPANALRQARQTHVSPTNISAQRFGAGTLNHRMQQQPGGSNMGRLNDFAQRFGGHQMQGGGGIRQAFVNHGQRQNIDMGQLRQTLLQRGHNSPISSASRLSGNGFNAIRMARDIGGGAPGSIASMANRLPGMQQIQQPRRGIDIAQRAGLQGFTMPTNIRYFGG